MGSLATSFGADSVSFGSVDTTTTLTSLSTATLATTAVTPARFMNFTSRRQLAAATYKIWVVPVGFDPKGGYTFGQATAVQSSGTPITSGQAIEVKIAQPWTGFTNFANAICAGIFIQKASENPVLCDWAPIVGSSDFLWNVITNGDVIAPNFPAATLNSTTVDPGIGSTRSALGVTWTSMAPTTGGIDYNFLTEGFEVQPDNTVNFKIVTSRAVEVSFALELRNMPSLAQAISGDYLETATQKQLSHAVYTVGSQLKGNQPILIYQAPSSDGLTYRELLMGNVQNNSDQVSFSAKKDASFKLQFKCAPGNFDNLLAGMANGIKWGV